MADEVDPDRADDPPRTRRRGRTALLACGVLVLAVLAARIAIGAVAAPVLGVKDDGRLAPCPDRDNCVDSRAGDPRHAIEPLPCTDDDLDAVIMTAVEALPRTSLAGRDGDYAHLMARSRWFGFVDDLELQVEQGVTHVRSASRLGADDLGVNRDRVEALRAAVERAGVCR